MAGTERKDRAAVGFAVSYANLTFADRNPVKRWLQRQRLVTAAALAGRRLKAAQAVCDFGAGNGELCKLLSERYQSAKLICYEPAPDLLAEARENLKSVSRVEFCRDVHDIERGALDLVLCLEVFEHLPPEETVEALRTISAMLKPGGTIVIGVPVEVGLPALYKGIFRMSRRYGAFDATPRNIAISFLGRPPQNRPISEIAPGLRFHFYHLGFDFRSFKRLLEQHFESIDAYASPVAALGTWLMPEVYFVGAKPADSFSTR
jgi:SAM-dependent methyltransferase